MPELPDVEGFRAVLAGHATGQRVERVDVADAGVLRGVTARQLDDTLRGRSFARPERHGKWLIAPTDGPAVLLHFGMTGSLQWLDRGAPLDRYDRVTFVTGAGELRYRDMRKLQGITLARSRGDVDRVLAGLGPDALDVTPEELDHILEDRRGAIKAVLIDQKAIAGLGNLLADEILWRAGIHPRRPARSLTAQERRGLYRQMRSVLRASVRAGRVPARPSWLTGARDQQDPRCPRCGAPLCRARIGGRTTVWCPIHQGGEQAVPAKPRPATRPGPDAPAETAGRPRGPVSRRTASRGGSGPSRGR
jgi:formamidopyrimidine-DNA glycosylase